MSPEERASVRRKHQRSPGTQVCDWCGDLFPCTLLELLDEFERVEGLLVDLKFAAGRYIECDERPRTPELWTAMCEAQEAAAVFLNTRVSRA